MNKDVLVSVCCITYNQQDYIGKALESFINQKTNFKYEIIIHDDASTDNTADIIREYEKKYPDIIKPIYQTENQYSKKLKMFPIVFKKAIGKYIALCEGDDYWCDEYKLQKQYDFMEKNTSCSLITTGAYLLDENSGNLTIKKQPYKGSRYYSLEEIILGDGGLFSTNSMFFRTKYVLKLPKFYYIAPVEDYPLTIYLALKGSVYYLKDITSVYRVNAKGSWSIRMNHGDFIKNKEKLLHGLQLMFDELNIETNNKHHNIVELFLLGKNFEILNEKDDSNSIKDNKFKKLYRYGNKKSRIKYFIKIKLNPIYKKIKK